VITSFKKRRVSQMKEKRIFTVEDMQRYKIVQDVLDKKLKLTEASELLGLSYRQSLRVKEKVKSAGLEAFLRASRKVVGFVKTTFFKI